MKRYIKKIILVCMVITSLTPCNGQNKEYDKEKAVITEVKRNPSKYIYAEATCKSEEEAEAVAEEMFLENINEYVNSVKKLRKLGDIVLNDQKGLRQVITMPRGTNMHRVFLYVKKSDVVAMKNPVVLTNTSNSDIESVSTISSIDGKTSHLDISIPQPIQDIAGLKTLQQLNQYLKTKKQSGQILAYEKYNQLQVKSEWYLVVYDVNGSIKAVLTDGNERINVMTKVSDSEKNYPGHAALGIKVKK